MAYTNFTNCTASEYKNILYNQQTDNKIKILFNNVELEDADEYCETFEVQSRVIPHGSKVFTLSNLVSQEATLVLHNIDTSIIQDQVSISIGTLVSENTYEYVPIGIYNLQELPTTDNGKTTIKLRDNSVKLDFLYNAKPIIDEHGGSATKLQILQDICTQAGITCNVSSFIGSSDLIGIYDNTIKGRQYVSWLAESAGAMPIITRSGALDFVYLNNLAIQEIPIDIVEKYTNAENFEISRVVYEDATRKYEYGNGTKDTLFIDSANPYISSQSQIDSIYPLVNGFNINSFTTGRILGNPAIDPYDLIQITDYDNTIFKTFANNTLRYNGKLVNTFDSEISFEQKKENVSLTKQATFKKWAKTEIDNVNAEITLQAGQIEEIENDLSSPTTQLSGTSFDIEDALDQPLQDFKMYGDTQQDSTTGKNLFDIIDYTTLSVQQNNATVTQTSNKISFVTKANNYSGFYIYASTLSSHILNYNADTIYTISFDIKSSQTASILIGISGGTQVSDTATTTIKRVSFTAKLTNNVIIYSTQKRADDTIEVSNIMISTSSDTPYEPYTNGASPNPEYPQEIHNVSGDNTIEICGKNLLKPYSHTRTASGFTFTTNEDGTIIANGTASSSFASITNANAQSYLFTLREGTYTLSGGYSNDLFVQLCNSSGGALATSKTTSATFTINEDTQVYYRAYVNGGTSATNVVMKPMLEKGITSSEYEAYTGQSQLISLGVENLFNSFLISNEYLQVDTDGTLIANGTPSENGYTSTGVKLSNLCPDLKEGDVAYLHVDTDFYYNDNLRDLIYIGETWNSGTSKTITATMLTRNVIVYGGYNTTSHIKVMISKVPSANYYPYGTTPIELNKISTYQDYIYKDNDKWYSHKEIVKVVLDENSNISTHPNGTNSFEIPLDNLLISNSTITIISSHFKGVSWNNRTTGGNNIVYGITENGTKAVIRNTTFTSLNDFKTWLSTNNVSLYYMLATPTNTEITDTTLLEQLDNLMTIPLIKDLTHIIITPNDLTPTLNIEYLRNTSINENFVRQPQLENYYTRVETDAQINISSNAIQQSVIQLETLVDSNGDAISSVSNQVQNLQTSTSTQINTINQKIENGVETLVNNLVTIDINGINVSTNTSKISTIMTNSTFAIKDTSNTYLAYFGYDEVEGRSKAEMDNLTITNYLTSGAHRIEKYEDENTHEIRTGYFYVGGGD